MQRAKRILPLAVSFGLFAATSVPAHAYVTDGAWPTGNIVIDLQFDGLTHPTIPGGHLTDGSATWAAAVQPTVTLWNSYLSRSHFSAVTNAHSTASGGDGVNNAFFSKTVYGQAWGGRTLAVTLTSSAGLYGLRFTENDVLFNSNVSWDSYRGALRSNGVEDIRRVAQHEFGHLLGLDHPDEDDPPQSVAAIMNSVISNIEVPQTDDIAGVQALYSAALPTNAITRQPQSLSVAETATASMSVEVNGHAAPPASATQKYAWTVTPPNGSSEFLFGTEDPVLLLSPAQTYDAGTYQVAVETPDGEVQSGSATLAVSAAAAAPATRLANLSTRGLAGAGLRSLIVGFAISGTQSRRVLLRAIGPGLVPMHVAGTVADPILQLKNASGTTIAADDNWEDTEAAALNAAFQQTGAFPLASGSTDAALIATLSPGTTYTALVNPKNGVEGIALVEAYDLDAADATNRIVNLSTRGYVGTGDEILIGGLVVSGPGPRRYLLRVAGDSLQALGVTGTLDDPMLWLFDAQSNLLRKTDDWDTPAFLQPTLNTAMQQAGAFALTDRQESVLLVTLQPGNYTLQARGFGGSTGIALLEAYEIEP